MKATCTWGDGPDVLVDLDGTGLVLYEDPKDHPPPKGRYKYGHVNQGSLDLTATEAENLGIELITAAKQARDMDRVCHEHDEVETAENNSRLNPSFGTSSEKTIKWKNIE